MAQKTLGRYASLVEEQHLTPAFVILALLLAALWGAMHALSPGHGKTIVAAYLVGERGTGRHALFLGLVVTATHTISVFTLGLVALLASDVLAAEDVFYWLSLLSGDTGHRARHVAAVRARAQPPAWHEPRSRPRAPRTRRPRA